MGPGATAGGTAGPGGNGGGKLADMISKGGEPTGAGAGEAAEGAGASIGAEDLALLAL